MSAGSGHRVIHRPRPEPAPAITVNLHRAAANWGAKRAEVKRRLDWEDWRERARAVRADAVRHLPELVERFEERVRAAGGHVHHAATTDEANDIVVGLCRARGARSAAKAKSMTSEETGLNEALATAGIEPVETDLGEYIVQQLGDRPSHVLAPAVHLSASQVAELFTRLSDGRPFSAEDTEELVGYARDVLRGRFLEADVGITGANMLVAETGTIVLVESEGNIRLSSSLPRTHIALVGIEKVVRDWDGAAHLLQTLPLASHGRPAAGSSSLITGPARAGDDGPEELHVVLLDAGRSAVRGTPLEEVLHCIRCGACLYACPVYRQTGGHAYGTTYSGPIGAVLTPALEGVAPATHELPWMSSLCGACSDACPVKIPLDRQLVTLRAAAQERDGQRAEAALFDAWARLWSRPAGYRATAATAGKALAPLWARVSGTGDGWVGRAPFPFAGWTSARDAPEPAREPFHERWRKRRGSKRRTPPPPSPLVVAEQEAAAAGAARPDALEGKAVDVRPDLDPLDAFRARWEEVDGRSHVTASLDEARALARELIGDATVAAWRDDALEGIATREAPAPEADVSLVAADVAVADTGQVGWAHGAGRPRGAGVLPPRQVILLRADRVVRTLRAALAHLDVPSAVLVAGPSRTADIEQRMIRGMHAPREIDVVVYPVSG